MPSNTETSEAIRNLRAERERLKEEHLRGLTGREHAKALTAAMDAAVKAVWSEAVAVDRRIALVALGGYGRAEMAPHSDIDLMVLHGGRGIAPDVGKRLFYELWDAGFVVGHAIRTVKDSLRLAAVNLEAETSFLDARLLAGDAGLFHDFSDATVRQTRKRGGKFLSALRESIDARRHKDGYASYWLEPNVKDGAGGLRDRSILGWLTTVYESIEDLSSTGPESTVVDILLRVRSQLHYLTDRRTDILLLAYHQPVAEALGYQGNGKRPEDQLLREFYGAAREIEFAVSSALAHVGTRSGKRSVIPTSDPGVVIKEGLVHLADRRPLSDEPALAMRTFAVSTAEGAPVASETLQWLREQAASIREDEVWDDDTRRAFFEILRAGDGGAEALEAMDQAGLLSRFLPEWQPVRCLPQHNVYHRFTVDVHLFRAAAEACRLADNDSEPLARDIWRDLRDRDRVLLACLLHDIGKGHEEDHSILGEALAEKVCARMGLNAAASEDVVWLVRHHLRLSDTATRRDVSDENLVVETAAGIADIERVKMLYILSVADGTATGPAAWTPWKAALVAELVTKILHVLERGDVVGRDASELVRLRTTELRQALTRFPEADVDSHVAGMSRAYLLSFTSEALIRHFALMAPELGSAEVRTHASPSDAGDVYDLIVVARDRPGLFSKVSGVLALNGINVLSAQIFTRDDGVALEAFRVQGTHERTVDEARWERVAADAQRVLAGKISLDVRLAEKRDAYDRPSKGKREPPRVIVDNKVSDFYTVVEVHATDRIGLLYAITRALADMELDIHAARVATYADDVVDVFYVRDIEGQKVTDPEHIREIERTALMRIEQ